MQNSLFPVAKLPGGLKVKLHPKFLLKYAVIRTLICCLKCSPQPYNKCVKVST